jgi:DNA-binding MarR family transcriptional regulator
VTAARRDLLMSFAPITRALRRIEDGAAQAAGLTMWQFAILSIVDETPDLNQGAVAKALAYSPNRIIADLDQLEERGLLIRRPGPDRRAKLLTTTPDGVGVMGQIRREIHRGEDELLSVLTPEQRVHLSASVHVLAAALRLSE